MPSSRTSGSIQRDAAKVFLSRRRFLTKRSAVSINDRGQSSCSAGVRAGLSQEELGVALLRSFFNLNSNDFSRARKKEQQEIWKKETSHRCIYNIIQDTNPHTGQGREGKQETSTGEDLRRRPRVKRENREQFFHSLLTSATQCELVL